MLGHSCKIMIVEDNALIANMLEAMVEDMGYQVVGPYRNLQDAVDHARVDEIDFGLLDFDLGHGTDVVPVVEILSERGVPFAITSGSNPSVIWQSIPAVTILQKPVVVSELEAVLPGRAGTLQFAF